MRQLHPRCRICLNLSQKDSNGESQGQKAKAGSASAKDDDPANAGLRREPGLPEHEDIAPEKPVAPEREFRFDEDSAQDEAARNRRLHERMKGIARNASLDPDDGIEL